MGMLLLLTTPRHGGRPMSIGLLQVFLNIFFCTSVQAVDNISTDTAHAVPQLVGELSTVRYA